MKRNVNIMHFLKQKFKIIGVPISSSWEILEIIKQFFKLFDGSELTTQLSVPKTVPNHR